MTTEALLRLRAALTAAARRLAADPSALTYEELADRRRYTDALLETIEVGIVACDADGTFLVSNRAERHMFGLDECLDGHPMRFLEPRIDVFDADGRRLEPDDYPLMRALRGEDMSHLEVLGGPVGGPYRQLSVRGRQITGPDGQVLGAVAALTDVTAERDASRELADEHRRLAEAQRLGKLGSFDHDFATGRWVFSEHVSDLWGLPPDQVTEHAIRRLIVDDDRETVTAAWHAAASLGRTQTCDIRIRRADDGTERLLRVNIEVEADADGNPVHGRGTYLDVTDVNAAEMAAREANAFFHGILTAMPDCTFVTDLESGTVIYASPGKEVLGRRSEDLADLGYAGQVELAHPDDRPELREAVAGAARLADGEVAQFQYRACHADGRWRWLSQRLTPFRRDSGGRAVEILGVVRDVTDVVEAQDRLVRAARHDYLTGLPNRIQLVERLEAALRRPSGDPREVAVLFCDLDGFKRVNDLGGHAAGDVVLTEAARRLVAVVRDEDVVARMGGDEFVVVVEPWNRSVFGAEAPPPGGDRHLAHRVAERVVEALRRPIVVDGTSYAITASVGIAYAPVGATAGVPSVTADALLHWADTAMYRAKEQGRDRFEVYELPNVGHDSCNPNTSGIAGTLR